MGGILPFGCIFIQLFFILNSIWSHQMYYMFGFLFLVFIILVITCSEATILLCYFHLCAEDYHWQWRSFLTSGFTAVYFLIYAIHYFYSKLQITGTASTILYFGYTMIMVLIFFLFTGTIGFFACFWFVTKIYSVVKVDWKKALVKNVLKKWFLEWNEDFFTLQYFIYFLGRQKTIQSKEAFFFFFNWIMFSFFWNFALHCSSWRTNLNMYAYVNIITML